MLTLRRARIPVALLPKEFAGPRTDPLEPTVLCDLQVGPSAIIKVSPSVRTTASAGSNDASAVDLAGSLVFPGLVDGHVHLDKTHTWSRVPNRSGTFEEALRVLATDKDNWSAHDLRRRAGFALRCAWAHGTRLIRTHVDTGLPWAETSHAVLAELRELWKGRIALQTVPLCPVQHYGDGHGDEIADLALEYGSCALGGFAIMSPDLPAQFDRLLAIARDRGVGLDLHVDENGNPAAECLRLIAEAVLRTQFPFPVVCGHCCSLAVQTPVRQRDTIDRVKAAGIGVISLPLCNLYLQDRKTSGFPRTPSWRGLTLIQDLLDAGVPVACASDNVRDAFYAFGDMDMLEVYVQSVRLAQLDTRLESSVQVVTTTAAELLGRSEYGRIGPGAPAHLVVLKARSFSELLSRPALSRRCVDGEEIREWPVPDYAELD